MTCVSNKDSHQPGHLPSHVSLATHKAQVKTDQTGWMPRLIRVFPGRIGHFVVRWIVKDRRKKLSYPKGSESMKSSLWLHTWTFFLATIWATSWQNQQNDCVLSEDSDQPGHLPSLIRVFTVHMKKAWTLSYPLSVQWRLIWVDAQADPSLCWAHSHIVGFVMKRLNRFFFFCNMWLSFKSHFNASFQS